MPEALVRDESQLLAFLDRHAIRYQRVEHPPVFTCEQAERYHPSLPAVSTKNLFLRDVGENFFLAMTACEKQLDLKAMGSQVAAQTSDAGCQHRSQGKKLHFASPKDLLACLGVTPGAVTILGLVNDIRRQVTLLVDIQYWSQDYYLCHPLVNTATLVLAKPDLLRFCEVTGHIPLPVEMLARQSLG